MTCFKTLININELQFIVSNMNREPYLGIENTQWVGVGKLVKCSQTTEIQDLIFNSFFHYFSCSTEYVEQIVYA